MQCMRRINAIAAALLLAASLGPFARQYAGATSSHSARRAAALPTVHAQEAIRVLKQENLYDSLTAAYHAAQ